MTSLPSSIATGRWRSPTKQATEPAPACWSCPGIGDEPAGPPPSGDRGRGSAARPVGPTAPAADRRGSTLPQWVVPGLGRRDQPDRARGEDELPPGRADPTTVLDRTGSRRRRAAGRPPGGPGQILTRRPLGAMRSGRCGRERGIHAHGAAERGPWEPVSGPCGPWVTDWPGSGRLGTERQRRPRGIAASPGRSAGPRAGRRRARRCPSGSRRR